VNISSYDLTWKYDGQDSSGTGTVTLDSVPSTLSWITGGRDCDWTLDGRWLDRYDAANKALLDFLDSWTKEYDDLEVAWTALGLDSNPYTEAYHVHIRDGRVLWLITDNDVKVGTVQPLQ